MQEELKKLPNENEEQYLWRLGQAKESGLLDIGWNGIADAMNKECRKDESEYRTESAYRKTYQQAKRFYEAGVFEKYSNSDSYIDELTEAKHKLRIEKQKLFDERAELNRKLREQARNEELLDIIVREINKVKPIELNYTSKNIKKSTNDLICHFTDIHTGIEIDHWYNKFNTDILKQRIERYLKQVFEIQNTHNSENCYLVIGETMSGLIHETLRIENNENVIEQFITVSTLISGMIAEMTKCFNYINVYVTPGNHSRVMMEKNMGLRGENFDLLLPHYLRASLQNYQNINIYDNEKDCDIAEFNVRGNNVFASHGDKDTPQNVVQNFTMIFGVKPDIVLLGHRHTNGLLTVFDTKVIQSGCVSGSDGYCLDNRLKNRPEQTVSVVDNSGLVCIYDIKLD